MAQAGAGFDIGALHLAGQKEAGGGIEVGSGTAGNGVGAAGAGGDQADAQVVGDAGVGFGSDAGSLLVNFGDELDAALAAERIIQVHRAAAGDEENVLHAPFGDELKYVVR